MARAKVTKASIETFVDHSTGEIMQRNERLDFIIKNDEPPYIKLYFEHIAMLSGVSNYPVMASLLSYIDYDGIVILNKTRKDKICKSSNCSVPTIDRVLNEMLKSGIAQRITRWEYLINPNIFGKGAWSDIAKAMERFEKISINVLITNNGAEINTAVGG